MPSKITFQVKSRLEEIIEQLQGIGIPKGASINEQGNVTLLWEKDVSTEDIAKIQTQLAPLKLKFQKHEKISSEEMEKEVAK
jgi:hypothetical protein